MIKLESETEQEYEDRLYNHVMNGGSLDFMKDFYNDITLCNAIKAIYKKLDTEHMYEIFRAVPVLTSDKIGTNPIDAMTDVERINAILHKYSENDTNAIIKHITYNQLKDDYQDIIGVLNHGIVQQRVDITKSDDYKIILNILIINGLEEYVYVPYVSKSC